MPTVLITGGEGRPAGHFIDEFLTNPDCPYLRVSVRSSGVEPLQRAHPLLTQAPHSIIVVDYMDAGTLITALRNVDVVVHDGPVVHQREGAMGMFIIEAAKEAGVQHFVFCSVLHPMMTKLLTHQVKLQTEECLIESRIAYTILQGTDYMQNVSLSHVSRTGKVILGYSPFVEQGFVDLRDVAQVLRTIVLHKEKHKLATYELVSQNMTYTDVAEILQELAHRSVECEVIPVKRYIEMMKEGGVIRSEYAEDSMGRIMMYHDRWGLTGNSNVLRWLLGREPRTWRQYATEMLQQV